MTLNSYLVRGTLVGALGGLLFGFDTAVIAGTTHMLTQFYALSSGQLGFTVSSALIGTVIGAMLAGIPGQRIGRRDTLRILAVAYVVSAIGCALAWNWYALLFFRVIGGLGIGGSSVLGPMYIAEIAPAKWRGRLVGTFQINIVLGVLLAYMSNFYIETFHLGMQQWRWQLGVAGVPAALFLVMLLTIGRSPRWLVMKARIEEAREALLNANTPDLEAELQDIIASVHLERQSKSEPLLGGKYRLPIFLAVSIAIFNQLTGINAIIYYMNDIFAAAGFNSLSAGKQAVYVGLANLIATVGAISVIDKLGRKTLLLIGSVGMAICLLLVAIIFQIPGPSARAAAATRSVYRRLRYLAGRGHLGVPRGGLPHTRARQRAKPRHLRKLDQQCHPFRRLSCDRSPSCRRSLLLFRRHDGAAILRRALHLSRDQGPQPGADAAQDGHRLGL